MKMDFSDSATRNNRRHRFVLMLLVTVVCARSAGAESPAIDHKLAPYLDTSLPTLAPGAAPAGRFESGDFPDTLDLSKPAALALNQASRLWNADWDYEQEFGLHFEVRPPMIDLGHGGLLNCGPKVIEALPMLRAMTGSTERLDIDARAMSSLLHITARDGLCYQPVENRPWAAFEEFTKKINAPYCDIFGEGRQLLAYASWFELTGDPIYHELAVRKATQLRRMVIKSPKGNYFFRLSRGYTPWENDYTSGTPVPIGDHEILEMPRMEGLAAAYIVGWIPMACAKWRRLAGDPVFEDLGRGLAYYLVDEGKVIDPENGAFLVAHETHVTHSLLANLAWALSTGDTAMIEWVRKAFEGHIALRDPHQTGIIFNKEACSISDVIGLAVMLSAAGHGNYWDVADRWLRNSLLPLQVRSVKVLDEIETRTLPKSEPGWYQKPENREKAVGTWFITMNKTDESIGCCNGNCARILYYLWDQALSATTDTVQVNLPLNRAAKQADVLSYLPMRGEITLRIKQPLKIASIMIPGWVDLATVRVAVNGQTLKEPEWKDRYVKFGPLQSGDIADVRFSIEDRVIPALIHERICRVKMRGSTAVRVEPDFFPKPLGFGAEREAMDTNEVQMHQVRHFIPAKSYELF